MNKEIKNEVEKLFLEMKEEIKKVWLRIKFSHRWTGWIIRENSETIWDFRLKALKMARDVNLLSCQNDRNDFMRAFGRKTTPYYWLKKDIIL